MGLRFYIRSQDGTVTEYDAGRFRFADLSVTENAEEGSVGTSSLIIHDPNGDLDITGHRVFGIKEDSVAAASNTFLYVGYTAERKIRRGDSELTATSRIWEVTLTDVNTVIDRRIMLGADANRPAETDVARMNWLLGTNEASRIDSTLYVSQANGVAMDAADYRGQSFGQVVDDCRQASGKNFYVSYWGESISAEDPWGFFGAWYDFAGSTAYRSMLRITNVQADVDADTNGNTFYMAGDTELTRDPSRVYSGVYLPWDGGNTYLQDADTYNQFAQRDVVMYAQNVKTAAKANARALRYLDDLDTEEDVITTSIIVPAAKVNHARAGMNIAFKAAHLPGYESFVDLRILNRTVQQLSDDQSNAYKILLELSAGDSVTVASTPVVTEATGTLLVGSASYLGLGADRENHFFSDIGATRPTLIVGKQYRMKVLVLQNLVIPLGEGPDSMSSYGVKMSPTTGSVDEVDFPAYSWDPSLGTFTTDLGYSAGPAWFKRAGHTHGLYATGQVIVGDWVTFAGPQVTPDPYIHGQPLSGFYGFYHEAELTIESRDVP